MKRAALSVVLLAATAAFAQVGRIDTVGGTTYDWQFNGPVYRMICNSPEYGIHVVWMYSASNQTTFPDRNMRYNFYDYSTREWNWTDPDHMQSGVNVFTDRCGYGNLGVDPATGVAVVSAHLGTPIHPDVGRDMAPGAGIFEYCTGSPVMDGYLWPPVVTGIDRVFHVAMIDDDSRDRLFYSGCSTWCQWTTPFPIAPPQSDPTFPSHNIAASRVSQKVVITWVYSGGAPSPGFYRESSDGGATWGPPAQLLWPPAFSGDTLPSFCLSSLFPYYDRDDQLHIVAAVIPFFRDRLYQMPAEIWHWCPSNFPEWSRIHRAGCDSANLRGMIGYNNLYAGRPSIGEDRWGGLYVTWEQFDSLNVERVTNLLRADIFLACDSLNNGQSWKEAVKITCPDSSSKRFPSVLDYSCRDTTCVLYMIAPSPDTWTSKTRPRGNNLIVCHWVPLHRAGIRERQVHLEESSSRLAATLVRAVLQVRGDESARLLDITGRLITEFAAGPNDIRHLAPGVYFVVTEQDRAVSKVILQR